MQPGQTDTVITYAISAVVIGVVFAIRWKRMSRVRPLKVERLWIFPTFYAVVAVYLFVRFPPAGFGWLFCGAALLLGAGLGWQRGKLMRITVDPVTRSLNQTSSPAAVLFLLVLLVLRFGAREMAATPVLHLNPMAVTDMLVALALGLFTMQRLEMYLRARRMLAMIGVPDLR